MITDFPYIFWYTSQKTERYLFESVKSLCTINCISLNVIQKSKIKRAIFIFNILRNRNCKGIIIDSGIRISILLLCKLFDVPIFMRLRGGMSGEFHDYTVIKSKILRYITAIWKKFNINLMLSASEKIFTVSIFGKSQVLYELPEIDRSRIKVLYEPVDLTAFDNATKKVFRSKFKIDDSKILLTATNFNYRRKYEAILEYHTVIVDQLHSHTDWVYVIIGGGNDIDTFKNSLLSITPKDIVKRVFVLGFYQNSFEAFIDSDLFINLSYRDTAAQVVKEAHASSIPVIGNYSCFGSNEFIQNHPKFNLLFETHQDLSSMLSKLLSNKSFRIKLGKYNREYAEIYYNTATISASLLNEIGIVAHPTNNY